MNKMWVRLSLAFSLVMLITTFLPALGIVLLVDKTNIPAELLPASNISELMPSDTSFQAYVVTPDGAVPIQNLLLFLACIILTIGTLAGLWVSRSFSKPTMRLVSAVQAIGKQDLKYRVPEEGTQELRDLAHAFNQMAEDLEIAEKIRRNQLADVTHELRTPLTVLQGNLKAMLDGVYTVNNDEIKSLYAQTEHLEKLIYDLHLLALAEVGQLPNIPQKIDLLQVVDETVTSFKAIANENSIQLSRVANEGNYPVEMDPRKIEQILHNLLSNSIKNIPSGGNIIVRLERDLDAISLSVSDTGKGIPPDELPLIFDRFSHRGDLRRRDTGGSGLGLAITKKIVESLQGSINAQSELGKGSTFTVRLPGKSTPKND